MTIHNFKKRLTLGIVFLAFFLLFFVISSENLTDYVILTDSPRLRYPKLLALHSIANILLFLSKLFIGLCMLYIYNKLKPKQLPFMGFVWIYAIWFILMSIVFAFNLLAIVRVYIWIDGLIRILGGIFGVATAISLFRSIPYMLTLKNPEEFGQLADEIRELREENKGLQRILNTKTDTETDE